MNARLEQLDAELQAQLAHLRAYAPGEEAVRRRAEARRTHRFLQRLEQGRAFHRPNKEFQMPNDPQNESNERLAEIFRNAQPPDQDAELYASDAVVRGHNPVVEREESPSGHVTRLVLDPTGRAANRGGQR